MRFRLEVDLDALSGDAAFELGRILRYWGGATKQLDLTQPQTQDLYDSSYAKPVGSWTIEADNHTAGDADDATVTPDTPDAR